MKWILALIIIFFWASNLASQRLSEKYHEKTPTQDTFLDKNHNGINDKIESKGGTKSLFEGIIEGINSKSRKKHLNLVPEKIPKKTPKPIKEREKIIKRKKFKEKLPSLR
jgi:hypothetical protein